MKFILRAAFFLVVVVMDCHAARADRKVTANAFGLIELTVVSTNDLKPLDNVTVSWWAYLTNVEGIVQEQTNAFTGTDGVARMRVPAGMYSYSISKINWLPSVFQITIKASQTTNLTIQLVPAPRISGIVRDPSGAPAVGVRVAYHPGSYPGASEYTEVKTGANGRYELILQQKSSGLWGFWDGPMCMTNFIMARDLEKNLAAIEEFAGTPRNVDLTLQPGITLSGLVKDIQGAPVSNATVEMRFLCGDSIRKVEERPTQADSQGLFSIPALPQGRDYYVFNDVTAKGYGTAFGRVDAKNTKTNRYEFPAFVLKAANRKLAGRVVDGDGKPLAGALINLNGLGQPQNCACKTDVNGNFVLNAICDGPVQLHVAYFDPLDSQIFLSGGDDVAARVGDTNLVIQLGKLPKLTTKGAVFDPSGKPASGVSLAVWASSDPFMTFSSESDGKYRVRWDRFDRLRWPEIISVLFARDTDRKLTAVYRAQGIDHQSQRAFTTRLHLVRFRAGCRGTTID